MKVYVATRKFDISEDEFELEEYGASWILGQAFTTEKGVIEFIKKYPNEYNGYMEMTVNEVSS